MCTHSTTRTLTVGLLALALAATACADDGVPAEPTPEAATASQTSEPAAAYAPDPELEGILAAAATAAETQGGATIGVDVTDVAIEGDVADVSYRILIGGSPVADGSGFAVRVDGEWKVHVVTLCGLLQLSGAPEGCDRVEPPA